MFLSHFYKVLLEQMCFGQYFNMCMETFYQNKSVSVQIFINFNWNQCVSVNILICTGTNCIKPFVLVEKKKARIVLDQKCFSHIFIKFYQNKCVSVSILICARINSTKTLCFGRKKQQELYLIKSVSGTFLQSSTQTNVYHSIFNMCMEKFY